MKSVRQLLCLCVYAKSEETSKDCFEDVGFRSAVELARPEELFAIPRRLGADHDVLPLLFRS
jgi:hypothetical protein